MGEREKKHLWINAVSLAHFKGLARANHMYRKQHVIARLGNLPTAGRTSKKHLWAHRLEQWARRLKRRGLAAAHESERARNGSCRTLGEQEQMGS